MNFVHIVIDSLNAVHLCFEHRSFGGFDLFIRFTSIALLGLLTVSTASADSLSHSGQAVHHSARAASHGSVAAAEAIASVIAVPLVIGGGAIQISGAALESAGAGSVRAGSEVLNETAPKQKTKKVVRANAAPRLD